MSIVWNDKGFQLNGTQFQLITNLHDLFALKDQEGLVLGKPRDLIETYLDLFSDFSAPRIFELGIFRGGSTAFFNELLRPEKLVAIDFMEDARPGFKNYLDTGANAASVDTLSSGIRSTSKKISDNGSDASSLVWRFERQEVTSFQIVDFDRPLHNARPPTHTVNGGTGFKSECTVNKWVRCLEEEHVAVKFLG